MIIRFYREHNRWYADLPAFIASGFGTKEDCEMVAGADEWLNIIAQGEDEITLSISDEPIDDCEVITLTEVDKDMPEMGAIYRIGSYKGIDYSHRHLWLCPVTLFVFGKYPDKIFYK